MHNKNKTQNVKSIYLLMSSKITTAQLSKALALPIIQNKNIHCKSLTINVNKLQTKDIHVQLIYNTNNIF